MPEFEDEYSELDNSEEFEPADTWQTEAESDLYDCYL